MDVTLEDLVDHVNADDSEKDVLQTYLTSAKAVAKREINRPIDDLEPDELKVLDQIVLIMATDFYLNRGSSGSKGASKSFSSLDSLIRIIRKPPLGGVVD